MRQCSWTTKFCLSLIANFAILCGNCNSKNRKKKKGNESCTSRRRKMSPLKCRDTQQTGKRQKFELRWLVQVQKVSWNLFHSVLVLKLPRKTSITSFFLAPLLSLSLFLQLCTSHFKLFGLLLLNECCNEPSLDLIFGWISVYMSAIMLSNLIKMAWTGKTKWEKCVRNTEMERKIERERNIRATK